MKRTNNRKKAVITLLNKNPAFFSDLAKKSVEARPDKRLYAKRASWCNHYPERFGKDGNILPEWKKAFESK